MTRKIIVLAIIVTLILCGCNISGEEAVSQTVSLENVPEPYFTILSDYRTIVDFRLSNNFEETYNNGVNPEISEVLANYIDNGLEYNFSNMLVEMTRGMDAPSKETFGYVLQDVNKDGTAELFWVREDYFILAVFSIQDGQVKMIDAYWPRYKMIVTDEGYLYTQGSSGAGYTTFQMLKLESNGILSQIIEFGIEERLYYETTDGKKKTVNETRFEELFSMYPFEEGTYWKSQIIHKIFP